MSKFVSGKEADVPKCSSNSPAALTLSFYKLKGGNTLKELYDDQISLRENLNALIGAVKYINTTKQNVSGLTAIQTISTFSISGSFGKLAQKYGTEASASKDLNLYMVNGSNGYRIFGHTDDESDFDSYYPTFQKMINSIQIQGPKESPENTSFQPAIKNTPTDDVILLSQKLKKGSGGYNDIIGQVKNIDTTTVDYVKIGLTTYDENGDVIGTDSAYAESTTLKPKQKSTFDIFTPKDSFDGMKDYELSLYWQDILGNDHYVENAQVYKDQK